MVGVKWLCRCDVFLSQVARISIRNDGRERGIPTPPKNNGVYAKFTDLLMDKGSFTVMNPL